MSPPSVKDSKEKGLADAPTLTARELPRPETGLALRPFPADVIELWKASEWSREAGPESHGFLYFTPKGTPYQAAGPRAWISNAAAFEIERQHNAVVYKLICSLASLGARLKGEGEAPSGNKSVNAGTQVAAGPSNASRQAALRLSIAPSYDSRETGPRFEVETRVNGRLSALRKIPDPFIRTTVMVGWRDMLSALFRLTRARVEVSVASKPHWNCPETMNTSNDSGVPSKESASSVSPNVAGASEEEKRSL